MSSEIFKLCEETGSPNSRLNTVLLDRYHLRRILPVRQVIAFGRQEEGSTHSESSSPGPNLWRSSNSYTLCPVLLCPAGGCTQHEAADFHSEPKAKDGRKGMLVDSTLLIGSVQGAFSCTFSPLLTRITENRI